MKKKQSLFLPIGFCVFAIYAIINLIDSFVIVIPDLLITLFMIAAVILIIIGLIKCIMRYS